MNQPSTSRLNVKKQTTASNDPHASAHQRDERRSAITHDPITRALVAAYTWSSSGKNKIKPGQTAIALAARNAAETLRPSARAMKKTAGIAPVAITPSVTPAIDDA